MASIFDQVSGIFTELSDSVSDGFNDLFFGNDQPINSTQNSQQTLVLKDGNISPQDAPRKIPTAGVKTSSPATINDEGIIGSLFDLGGRYLSSFIDAQQVNDREQTQSEKVNPPQQPNRFKPPTAPAPISFANASGRLVDGVDNKLIYGVIGVAGVVLLVVAIR